MYRIDRGYKITIEFLKENTKVTGFLYKREYTLLLSKSFDIKRGKGSIIWWEYILWEWKNQCEISIFL